MTIARFAVVIAVLAARLLAQSEVPRAEPSPALEGGEVYEWTTPAGAPIWYRLPEKISNSSPPNLLVMLHGTGVKWGWAFWNYPIAKGAFRPDDVVVAPEGLSPGGGDTFNFLQGAKDGDHLAALIESFRAELPIGRVYLYGHSQGAFFCYWFAGEHPDLVDGIVAHAGNVLSVKHSDESREGVGIGILHGEADAVVPVECAHRSAKIYRDEGYRNVKLEVVEGLTEKSGHWPLPVQVGEMLAWLDEVTEISPQKAVDRALAAIRAEPPDLAAVAANLARARQLAKGVAAEGEDAFRRGVEAAGMFVTECRELHAEALLEIDELRARRPGYGPWAARFRAVDRVFAGDREWGKALGSIARTAKSHDKACAKAIAALGRPSTRSVRAARKALETAVLASGYGALRLELRRVADDLPDAVDSKERDVVVELLEQRAAADAEGATAAAELTAGVAKSLLERLPEVFGGVR